MNMHAAITPAATSAISRKAMLAGVTIKQWSGRKLDRKVTDDTNRDHGAAADAGRYNKALLSRDALAKIVAVANRARAEHYSRTLPWADNGARILSSVAYLEFGKVMRELRQEFEAAVSEFLAGYPDYVEAAKARLNGMFDAADYPPADEIRRRFGFDVSIFPMPDAADFRVDVADAEADRIRADIQARTDQAIRDAMADVFTRISLTVGNMAEKLAASRETAKGEAAAIFRDSLVENVRELVALLPGLNITGDAMLASLADRMARDLCRHDAEALREDAGARQDVAKAAAAILADVSEYMA